MNSRKIVEDLLGDDEGDPKSFLLNGYVINLDGLRERMLEEVPSVELVDLRLIPIAHDHGDMYTRYRTYVFVASRQADDGQARSTTSMDDLRSVAKTVLNWASENDILVREVNHQAYVGTVKGVYPTHSIQFAMDVEKSAKFTSESMSL